MRRASAIDPGTPARRRAVALCLAITLLATPSLLSAQAGGRGAASLAALEQRSGVPLEITRSPVTDLPLYIGTRRGHPIGVPVSPSAPAEARAAAFMSVAAPALGLASAADVEPLASDGPDELGLERVRYRQIHNQVPVAAAEVIVHLRGAAVTTVNGHTLPGLALDTTPTVGGPEARATALRRAAKARGGAPYGAPIALTEPRLEILNVGFFERRGLSESRLAWFVEATATGLRERIWVDALDGRILLQFSQLTDARNRLVHSAGGGSGLPGTLVRSEGQGPSGDVDVDDAYDYSGDTYDYYSSEHGRDSYDGAGATLSSTVDWCDVGLCGSCPCFNAFWNGVQMIYGDGFPAADDVVAHELTHAVTEYSAGLIYCLESGALNESFSDIFGEIVDLTNGAGTDTPAVRWLMGENVPDVGAIRNMSVPQAFGDPGKVSDPEFVCADACDDPDNGGVHSNSGVPNHAFALMVDGGTFNGFTITGIGLTKAGKIQYRALIQYLASNALFLDAYHALNQSCQDLIGTAGITAADCTEVMEALQAVEMHAAPCVPSVCGNSVPELGEDCDDGNVTNCDGCDANCSTTGCGNGVTACGEQCDDGNLAGGDGCEADCTLSAGCALHAAAGLPLALPDPGSVSSTIAVPVPGRAIDVNVVNLRGTHSFVGDLEFRLRSPANTTAIVVNNVCGDDANFDLGLDDEAPSPIPCAPTDGAAHLPSQPLAVFDGQSIAGNWVLTVIDQFPGDAGALDGWGLLVCTQPCGNGAPDPGEQCDDGNTDDRDGCTNACTICGNGATTAPEVCDDGDLDDGDGCDSNCTVTACGNTIVTPPEACDDGNGVATDVCLPDCTLNPAAQCPGNPFVNCSFETGNLAGWEVQDITVPFLPVLAGGAVDPGNGLFISAPTDGAFAALNGFDGDGPGTIEIAQTVQLPADAASLTFDYRAGWDLFTYGASLSRRFEVAIQHPVSHADLFRETILTATAGTFVPDTGNVSPALNILDFAGQSVRVSFEWTVPENFVGPAFFQLDHVRVGDTTPPPTSTPTPTATPTDTPEPGDCCSPHVGEAGCADSGCAACVCGLDPYCCVTEWDSICVDEANVECAASCPCVASPTPTATATPTVTPTPGQCAAAPVPGCATPGKSMLLIKDKQPVGPSASDKLIWKWLKGPALTQPNLGDPTLPANGYYLCVYDGDGLAAELALAGGGTCAGSPCWGEVGDSGYKYKDPSAGSDGVFAVMAKGGAAGKSKILLKGKGLELPVPTLPLDLTSAVVVQLFRDDAAAPCWQSAFPAAVKNDDALFKAKSQTP